MKLNRAEKKYDRICKKDVPESLKRQIVQEKLGPFMSHARINAYLRKWERVKFRNGKCFLKITYIGFKNMLK